MGGIGGGKQGTHDRDIYGFMLLGRVDREGYERCRSMYEKQQAASGSPSALYGWAVLNRVAKELPNMPMPPPAPSPAR
jgi:hypothetical protein